MQGGGGGLGRDWAESRYRPFCVGRGRGGAGLRLGRVGAGVRGRGGAEARVGAEPGPRWAEAGPGSGVGAGQVRGPGRPGPGSGVGSDPGSRDPAQGLSGYGVGERGGDRTEVGAGPGSGGLGLGGSGRSRGARAGPGSGGGRGGAWGLGWVANGLPSRRGRRESGRKRRRERGDLEAPALLA